MKSRHGKSGALPLCVKEKVGGEGDTIHREVRFAKSFRVATGTLEP